MKFLTKIQIQSGTNKLAKDALKEWGAIQPKGGKAKITPRLDPLSEWFYIALFVKKENPSQLLVDVLDDFNAYEKYDKTFPNTDSGYLQAFQYYRSLLDKKLTPDKSNLN